MQMTKTKLSDQQKNRINQQHDKRRERADAGLLIDDASLGHEQEGLVIAHHGQHLTLAAADGSKHRCYARKNLGAIAVGDQVIWRAGEQEFGVIVAVKPRRSELFRYNKFEGNKLVAANVDQLFIVVACEPPRAMNVIDRYLMLAELQRITPIIVFNKVDLLDAEDLADIKEYLSYYQTLNYPVLYCSTTNEEGITALLKQLADKTSIFVGLSGVGKSSLIKMILPGEDLTIGELSEKSREGNHTTTTAKLYNLPQGGHLIDCPGIRELSVGSLTAQEVLRGFKELAAEAAQCQFRDCSHSHEPGCALLAGLASEKINPDRFASYQSIVAQLSAGD
jgi:ribosome biogenesis GTPase